MAVVPSTFLILPGYTHFNILFLTCSINSYFLPLKLIWAGDHPYHVPNCQRSRRHAPYRESCGEFHPEECGVFVPRIFQ